MPVQYVLSCPKVANGWSDIPSKKEVNKKGGEKTMGGKRKKRKERKKKIKKEGKKEKSTKGKEGGEEDRMKNRKEKERKKS